MRQNIDPDLIVFVQNSVRSLWALEILLLLHRFKDRTWHEGEINREMRATPQLVESCLYQLERVGVAADDGARCWRYACANATVDQLVNRLAAAHRERPVAVMNALFSSSDERLRNLADAFRFKTRDSE